LAQFEQDQHHNAHVLNDRRLSHVDPRPGVPQILADRYEVLEEIGSGATAITYRGHDHRLNRNVAIKILREDHALDTSYVQRFEREARAAASISQGNVVDVYDFGEQDDSLYIVMQYIDGEDLKQIIIRGGALDLERARRLTMQVLAGLAAIHAAGIIHRDIKPQNVLIGRDGIARVTDFGVAQAAIDVGLTSAGTTVGTAAYMAPEQAQAGVLGETTDIYAVGVVLYEMLTGKMPFSAPTPVAMMLAHIQKVPMPPSRQAPDRPIPEDLDAIVMQAMAKDPADRFQSALAMSRALADAPTPASSATVISAVPVTPRVVRQPRQTTVATNPDRAAGTWPVSPGPAALPPRVVLRSARGLSRFRRAAGGLLLSLAVAGGAAFGVSQWRGGDDDSPTNPPSIFRGLAPSGTPAVPPTVQAASAGAIPTSSEPTATAISPGPTIQADQGDQTPTAVPTRVPEPTSVPPTQGSTGQPRPTDEPTSAPPTEVPPTEVPPTEVPPTEVPPTEVPPTEVPPTDPPVEQPTVAPAAAVPTQHGQGSNLANRAAGRTAVNPQGTEQPGALRAGTGTSGSGRSAANAQGTGATQAPGAITIDHNDWKGDGAEKASEQDWMIVGPGEEVTARFKVDGTRSGGTFKVSIALAAVDVTQAPLRILINGTERLQVTDPLPTISSGGESQALGNLVLTVPAAFLQDGRNEITIVNGANAGTSGGGDDDGDDELASRSIVLGDAIITIDETP